ncbi:phospholipase D-like domain-containing protein [Streptomyces justiciae]|uniref:phospholipase D-like domain-containing protein n=1 Tax=Streptomyces justiciae TaxID=2780140 RepID=UPI002119B3A2|nr:phospholipase D-like domain-containing protein [Streptomyces justiciae]MCW8381392.1 phospholipase D-like domain-containing protein [Streptomyces justiciae]
MISNRSTVRHHSLTATMLFILAMLMTMLAAPPASAESSDCEVSTSGRYETCFIYGGGTQDLLLVSKIKGKIDATADASAAGETGNYIRVALYNWYRSGGGQTIADSLVRAQKSGVSVRVVVGPSESEITNYLSSNGIDVEYCPDACADPGHGSMHNKFFLIKKGDTKLVIQSSSNLKDSQATHAQNLLISRDDDALFSAYVNYWRRLYANSWTYDGVTWSTNSDRMIDGSNDLSKAYFYPQPGANRVADILGNVSDCTSGNDRVWMEASEFDSSAYASEIAAQLRRLRGIGCDVKIIVQKEAGFNVLTGSYGIPATDVHCDGWSHNKLLLIDAKYAGEWRKPVFVGSYNITENSAYRANDTMLRVIEGSVTNRYINQFQHLWVNPRACDPAGAE